MIFVGYSHRSSGQIRGIQISETLKRSGHHSEFLEPGNPSLEKVSEKTVVIVRQFERGVASHLKKRGCKIVFDILDRPVADIHESLRSGKVFSWSSYCLSEIDEFIVNNSLVKNEIERATGKKCTIIPHHSVGSEERVRSSIGSAGYIGLPDQLQDREKIESLLGKFGIKFYSKNPTTKADCIRDISSLDLGIIFLKNSERNDPVLKYKPNTKLTNFQSHGIPTISIPYHSFVEFGGDAWINSSECSFLSDLESFLCSSNFQEKIQELSIKSIENARSYSIDRICETYLRIDEK